MGPRPMVSTNVLLAALVVGALLLPASSARGAVDRIEISSRAPVAGGRAFGAVGPYEILTGRLHYLVDPDDPANQAVVGLGLAAIRDALAFFRYARADRTGRANPLAVARDGATAPDSEAALAFGFSRSARVLQHMILQGFHVDEAGRPAFDAALYQPPSILTHFMGHIGAAGPIGREAQAGPRRAASRGPPDSQMAGKRRPLAPQGPRPRRCAPPARAGRFLSPAASRRLAVSGTAAQRAPDWRQKSTQSVTG